MTIRKDPTFTPGLLWQALTELRTKGGLPAGGRTHNYSATDICFEDMECLDCGRPFEVGDEVTLRIRRVEAAQWFAAPVHAQECRS
jgi:hypothetical protein